MNAVYRICHLHANPTQTDQLLTLVIRLLVQIGCMYSICVCVCIYVYMYM